MSNPVVYLGVTPESQCDICENPVGKTCYDGRTQMGPWGRMCHICHRTYGVGLGTGKGQKYEWNPNTQQMEKVAG